VTTRILAVCAGNICRSPAAEAAIQAEAERAGVDVEVDSAGTGSWSVGNAPHPQVVAAGARAGINSADFDRFDVIVVMDRANLRDVLDLAPSLEDRAKVRLFRTFDPGTESEEVPDPYGGPDEGYDATIEQVAAAAAGLIDTIRSAGIENPISLE
jgi:protein-tyrosine phosphatase